MCDHAPAVQVDLCNHDEMTPDADARAGRAAARRRGPGAGARAGVRELPRRVPGARGARGGADGVTLDVRAAAHARLGRPVRDRSRRVRGEGRLRRSDGGARHGRRRHRGAGEGERPPRPRRRRLPDRDEVGVRAARHRQADVRRRELRRIRAGYVQQPRARRARSAPAAGGRRDRGARDRLRDGLHLRPRRVPVAEHRAANVRSPRRTRTAASAPTCAARASGSTSCCTAAPARTSAARRPRC